VRPDRIDLRHLLGGHEIRPWVMREMERLQLALSAEGAAPTLAAVSPSPTSPPSTPKPTGTPFAGRCSWSRKREADAVENLQIERRPSITIAQGLRGQIHLQSAYSRHS
jgi:hypothetical protein